MSSALEALFPRPDFISIIRQQLKPEEKVYLVGGAVRDYLLGRTSHDLDFVTTADARHLARKIADLFGGAFYMLDSERGTARVILSGEKNGVKYAIDFATLHETEIESDLRQRDFTINAMAIDIADPEHGIDPLNGAQDLNRRILRACSPSSLWDDPLRVLRAVRLAKEFELTIEPDTRIQLKAAVTELDKPSIERRRDEFFRILEMDQPFGALMVLNQLGILDQLLPELTATKNVVQPPPHTLDVYHHSLATVKWLATLFLALVGEYSEDKGSSLIMGMAVNQLGRFRERLHTYFYSSLAGERSIRSLLLFSALYHDVGKPETPSVDLSGKHHFYNHEEKSAALANERTQFLNLANVEIDHINSIIANHMRVHFLTNSGSEVSRRNIYRFFRDTNSTGIDICLLSLADALAREGVTINSTLWERELGICRRLLTAWFEEQDQVINPRRLITGDDLMKEFHLPPGPQVGVMLQKIHEAQAEGQLSTYAEAVQLAKNILDHPASDDERLL